MPQRSVLTQVHVVTVENNFIKKKIKLYKISLRMKAKNIHYAQFKILNCFLSTFPFKTNAKDEVKKCEKKKNVR